MFLSSYGRWISPTCERVEVYAVSGCTSPTKRNYFKKTSHGDLGLLDFRSKCLITNDSEGFWVVFSPTLWVHPNEVLPPIIQYKCDKGICSLRD